MLFSSEEIMTSTKTREPIQTMAALREMKNGFK